MFKKWEAVKRARDLSFNGWFTLRYLFWKGREHGIPFSNLASTSTVPPCSAAISQTSIAQGLRRRMPCCGIYPGEERLEDAHGTAWVFQRLIFDSQEHVTVVVADGDVDSGAGAAVTDGIFDQVKHQPIEERVASDYQSASTAIETMSLCSASGAGR